MVDQHLFVGHGGDGGGGGVHVGMLYGCVDVVISECVRTVLLPACIVFAFFVLYEWCCVLL